MLETQCINVVNKEDQLESDHGPVPVARRTLQPSRRRSQMRRRHEGLNGLADRRVKVFTEGETVTKRQTDGSDQATNNLLHGSCSSSDPYLNNPTNLLSSDLRERSRNGPATVEGRPYFGTDQL
jgi:hypothetical protein